MRSFECRVARQQIDELELGERLSERASAHLSLCSACRDFRAERTELRQLVGSLEPVVAPADFEMRLRARIAREQSPQAEPLFSRLFRAPALAAAALFVIVSGTVVWVAQRDDQTSIAPIAKQQPLKTNTNLATSPGNESGQETVETVAEDKPEANPVAANLPRKRASYRAPRTQDFDVNPDNPVRQGDAFVNAPSKPVALTLEDGRGTKRKISLPPVSFGAQSLVDNRVPVSYTGNSRIW